MTDNTFRLIQKAIQPQTEEHVKRAGQMAEGLTGHVQQQCVSGVHHRDIVEATPQAADFITPIHSGNGAGIPASYDAGAAEKYVLACQDAAQTECDALAEKFMVSILAKVDNVATIKLEAWSFWNFTELTVMLASGEKLFWRTRFIQNTSKNGIKFTQFRTRQVKKLQRPGQVEAATSAQAA